MGRISMILIGLFISLFFSVASVQAITIQKAEIAKGAVEVNGKGAVPGADISWEGQVVTQANKNGNFNFSTPILPGDCVGELSDGAETVEVVVKSCGPSSSNKSNKFGFVGFSTGTINGAQGMLMMHAECQKDFGSQARMCTSKEFWLSPNATAPGSASAWLHGVKDFFPEIGVQSCAGWTGIELQGLTVSTAGKPQVDIDSQCNIPRPVTCCGP